MGRTTGADCQQPLGAPPRSQRKRRTSHPVGVIPGPARRSATSLQRGRTVAVGAWGPLRAITLWGKGLLRKNSAATPVPWRIGHGILLAARQMAPQSAWRL